MPALQPDYFAAYRSLKLARDSNGVLVVEFHSNGGLCGKLATDYHSKERRRPISLNRSEPPVNLLLAQENPLDRSSMTIEE